MRQCRPANTTGTIHVKETRSTQYGVNVTKRNSNKLTERKRNSKISVRLLEIEM